MLKAVTRSARLVDEKVAAVNAERATRGANKISVAYYFDHYATEEDSHVSVVEDDFIKAKSELVPSVSLDELQHYERVRASFEGMGTKSNSSTTAGATQSANGQPAQHPHSSSNGEKLSRPPTATSDSTSRGNKLKDFMKRAASNMNGNHTRGQSNASIDGPRRGSGGGTPAEEAEDDYVVRTDKLSLNGNAPVHARPMSSKGKGKGKGKDVQAVQQVQEGEGEDLYD